MTAIGDGRAHGLMRVLYVSRHSFPNDRAYSVQIAHTCHALAKRGAEVSLYVGKMRRPSPAGCMEFFGLDLPDTLSVHVVRNPPWVRRRRKLDKNLFIARMRLICLTKFRKGPVFMYSRHEPVLAGMPRKKGGPFLVFEAHELKHLAVLERARALGRGPDDAKTQVRLNRTRSLEARALRNVHGIACITHGLAREIAQTFNPTCPVHVIPSGVLTRHAQPVEKDIDVVYCGRLNPWKGVDTLIEAMRWLPGYRLTVVGGVDDRCLDRARALAAELDVSGRIDFPGYVPYQEVWGYLDRARVAVLPTRGGEYAIADRYTSPMKLLEYMMCGVPVVASDLPPIREVLQDGVTAKLVTPNSPKALAEGMLALLKDEPLARQIAGRARERALHYTWENRAQKIIDLLNCAREKGY